MGAIKHLRLLRYQSWDAGYRVSDNSALLPVNMCSFSSTKLSVMDALPSPTFDCRLIEYEL